MGEHGKLCASTVYSDSYGKTSHFRLCGHFLPFFPSNNVASIKFLMLINPRMVLGAPQNEGCTVSCVQQLREMGKR